MTIRIYSVVCAKCLKQIKDGEPRKKIGRFTYCLDCAKGKS